MLAYEVNEILPGLLGREALKDGRKIFPHLPKYIFEEIKQKELDLLIGNANLGIQSRCRKPFGKCTDCDADRCSYRSWYGSGWVILGRLTGLGADQAGFTSSIRQITLCRVSLSLGDMFFQAESLGASPLERCT